MYGLIAILATIAAFGYIALHAGLIEAVAMLVCVAVVWVPLLKCIRGNP